MKILLLGEYSNVHATLAEGLRCLGHESTVVSNGDFWKDYPRDIDISRKEGRAGGIALMARLVSLLPRLRGYDVVQLINPMFVELKAERIFPLYSFLRKHNRRMVLGAFGMDYYWVNECCNRRHLRYSDFNIGNELRTDEDALKEQRDWVGTAKERLNRLIATDADNIVAGLYEYWSCYEPLFSEKTRFIPFPIAMPQQSDVSDVEGRRINIFIGINKTRSHYKGTDIMLEAAKEVVGRHPDLCRLNVAESVPFHQYRTMMDSADILLDQLYSYTPSMNTLLAMSKGIVCVGGGEPENYSIISENLLRPIVNVEPSYDSVLNQLEKLVCDPKRIMRLKRESIEYVERHHEYKKVAKQYSELYEEKLNN